MDFDEQTLFAIKTQAKARIRERMRALRKTLPASSIQGRSASIVDRLLATDAFARAGSVALYWPIVEQGEVDVRRVDEAARAADKRIYYPFIDPDRDPPVGFRRVDHVTELAPRGHSFAEPPASAPVAEAGQLDLIVVPALAVSTDGHRIGHGSGFYDQAMPIFAGAATTVAVAYDFQLLAELPVCGHDVACDLVVTDRSLIEVGRSATV